MATTESKRDIIEKVDDDGLIALITAGLQHSDSGSFGDTSLAAERAKATYEYGMLSAGHLVPQGVSRIVSSDTVEVVEGYLAILSELLFNNRKLVKFVPFEKTPTAVAASRVASDITNYVVFKVNNGWEILNTWVKAALLWKLGVVRWEWIEDHEYKYETFEEIPQGHLDMKLAEPEAEVVGPLHYVPTLMPDEMNKGEMVSVNVYKDVRIRTRVKTSRIAIRNIDRGAFLVAKGAKNLEEAVYIGLPTKMSESEIRRWYPEQAKDFDFSDVNSGGQSIRTGIVTAFADDHARKQLAGRIGGIVDTGRNTDNWLAGSGAEYDVLESWLFVDRDGDGIAERKRVITVNDNIFMEEDAPYIDIALLNPFEIPFELEGLSAADMARPSTLGTTAILRGFIENVYLTNYAPRLADPNTVDFSSLQNLKPKQLIPVNGNPNNLVASLAPDAISVGTVPLLELLQTHKEQATGLSKAAQGLNDLLFVSGNSEEKLAKAVSAAQVRIQYMARRFVETGLAKLSAGVYRMIREKMSGSQQKYLTSKGYLKYVDPATLPDCLELSVNADVGENGNSNIIKKMGIVGQNILPALKEAGAGSVISPTAAANIAAQTLEALDLDPLDYIVDYTSPDFEEKAAVSREAEQQAEKRRLELEDKIKQLDIAQREATIALTNVQSRNALQDNARQLMVVFTKFYQDWAEIEIKAAKDAVKLSIEPPKAEVLMQQAFQFLRKDMETPQTAAAITPEVPAGASPDEKGAPPV